MPVAPGVGIPTIYVFGTPFPAPGTVIGGGGLFVGPGPASLFPSGGLAGVPGSPEQGRGPGLPGVIDEIIVTAPRPTKTPIPRTGLAGIIATGVGFVAAEFLREISQQKLDEAGFLAVQPVKAKPDTPVVPMPAPPIPEITVTEKRGSFLQTIRQRFALPPIPQFFPREFDPDPFIMQPIGPAPVIPRPEVQPDVAIPQPRPVELPTRPPASVPVRPPSVVPMPIPTPTARPIATPRPRTGTPLPIGAPQTRPVTVPRPRLDPRTRPRPLTDPRTTVLPLPSPLPLPKPRGRPDRCPPCPKPKKCKKDRDKPRTECFKKLVKEGLLPRDDETFNWVEIDCFTGREL